MTRHLRVAFLGACAAASLLPRAVAAADPTTADCLAASDASLKAGNEHRLRAQRQQLLVCSAASCPADIRNECVRRVDEVNAEIPTLIFEVKDPAGNDLTSVTITMDGEVLAQRLDGAALSADPGDHAFTFQTPGQPPRTRHYLLREAEKNRRESIALGIDIRAAEPVADGPERGSESTPAEGHGLGGQRVGALVVGGLGVAALAAGGAFGLVAMSRRNTAQAECPQQCSDQRGVDAWSAAKSAGNASTGLFIGGGAVLAGAVALWLTAPGHARPPTVQLSAGIGAIVVKGEW
jgi:hypothetical protein